MAGAIVAALATSLAANAQNNATTGAVGSAVGGAIVGGPVGAVVGGVGGAIVGGIADDRRSQFHTYVVNERRGSYKYDRDVAVGAELPSAGVTYYEVPAEYGVRNYRYTIVNDRTVQWIRTCTASSRSSSYCPVGKTQRSRRVICRAPIHRNHPVFQSYAEAAYLAASFVREKTTPKPPRSGWHRFSSLQQSSCSVTRRGRR